MKLLRTIAMAAALAGAAAQDSASPAPPTATPATASPVTTTASPAPTTTRASTGSAASTPLATATPGDVTLVKLSSGVSFAKLNIQDAVTNISDGTRSFVTDTKPRMRLELVERNSSFQLQELTSEVLDQLEISGVAPRADAATVDVSVSVFSDLLNLTSLSFSYVKFAEPKVQIYAPTTLSYLKIENTDATDVSLQISDATTSSFKEVAFTNNSFAQLPLLFYQANYSAPLKISGTLAVASEVTELSQEEYAFAQHNLKDSAVVSFAGDCSRPGPSALHVLCSTTNRTGVRSFDSDNTIAPVTSVPTTATPTPSPTKHRSSANTTLTVIVVVISVIAAILAFLVARRYFWSSSRSSRSPRLNERTVGLISKDESHAAQGKLSFISADDTLRPIRLEPQEVAITKSVGAGKLWIGDYQGRKVIIKRVEAESNDSYATKALITQAKGLATLHHPSVVGMVGVAWVQGTDFGVVAEFMEKGTLKSILMDLDSDLDLQSKLHMCLDVAQALLYLHSNERNMYVKQLSSRKVLVNNAVECKLNLFECHSCSSKVELPEVFGAGMLAWEAPEVVTRSGVLNPRKMNIFSLGVLICEIMTRVSPYQNEIDEVGHTLADLELLKRIRRQEKLLPHENRREFTELPVAVRDLVERCLSYQPLLRPTAEEVVQILESAKGYSERFGSTTSL